MTRDAKVGLLLGLLFIFIIAFLINGLPSIRHKENNNELTARMVQSQNDPPALGAKERRVVDRSLPFRQKETIKQPFDKLGEIREGVSNASPEQPVVSIAEQGQGVELQPLEKVQTAVTEDASTRFEMLLPDSDLVVKDASIEKAADEVKVITPAAISDNQAGIAKTEQPKTYIVTEGDSLAFIAKKFYGEQEGNKEKNITRIFEANRKLLKAPDEIYIGQELIIPPLTITKEKSETKNTFPDGMFEKVTSIGQRQHPTKTNETKQSKVYIVQEGDSLWKIAAEQLGNGNRFPEISKLNSDILEDEDTLIVGMRLKLPG
jgi:nucleoid-associated protein YgaU